MVDEILKLFRALNRFKINKTNIIIIFMNYSQIIKDKKVIFMFDAINIGNT